MNKVCARHDTIPYQIEFPSPVYTSAIMGDREDICVGVGGGKRFGMPNIVIAIEKSPDPKLIWNVCSWLDLGDDIPWAGAKQPMGFAEEGDAADVQFLAMSHLDSVSIIKYEKNQNFDPKLLAEELQRPQEKPLEKRASPPPPKNGPVFLTRVAKFSLVTNADDPDKKVCAILRSATQPQRLSDQLFFVCQDDSSIAMFRLKKSRTVKKEKEDTKEKEAEEANEGEAATKAAEEEAFEYEVFSYTIPANELRMGTAHPTDMDARETPSGIVLMIVCDDKKVRVALLPQAWHCLGVCKAPEEVAEELAEAKACVEKDKAAFAEYTRARAAYDEATAKKKDGEAAEKPPAPVFLGRRPSLRSPLAVVVRSLLVLTPEDLGIPFAVMRSTLRVGLLMDEVREGAGGNKTSSSAEAVDKKKDTEKEKNDSNKEKADSPAADEGILVLVMAYDSKNSSTNAVMARITIADGTFLALEAAPSVAPVCKGAVTNLMPLFGRALSAEELRRNYRPMPEAWLATTVEGTIVELTQRPSGAGGSSTSSSTAKTADKASPADSNGKVYVYPAYETSHQRPHKPKRCPPHLAAVHQEPISSAAVSAKTGLLVTVDIAQKARLSRLELSTSVGDASNDKGDSAKTAAATSTAFEGLPLLFPLKSKKTGGASLSVMGLFAPFMVLLIAVIAVLAAVAPEMLPDDIATMAAAFGAQFLGIGGANAGVGGGSHYATYGGDLGEQQQQGDFNHAGMGITMGRRPAH